MAEEIFRNIESVYDIIDEVRIRPAMCLGQLSPNHLRTFLSAWQFARWPDNFSDGLPEFHGFHDWIAKRYDYFESTSGWANMIEDQCDDKEEALWLFFELLDEFRGITHEHIATIQFEKKFIFDTTYMGYSRKRKVRATYEAIEKPLPHHFTIRKTSLIGKNWYSIIAFSKDELPLHVCNHRELDVIIHIYGERIYGIPRTAWML